MGVIVMMEKVKYGCDLCSVIADATNNVWGQLKSTDLCVKSVKKTT
jgi:hypothetical protein